MPAYIRSSMCVNVTLNISMSFKNKVVILTGASSGIGAVMALEFAKAAAKLTLVARNVDNLNKIAERCASYHNHKPLVIGADMSVNADIEKIVKETIEKYKQIDVVINNAASIAHGRFENSTLEQFDAAMATNVRGVYLLIKLATPHLAASKGNVVNISSVAATLAVVGLSIYATSKAAQDHLTRCVAFELAPKGIRVNTVSPGATAAPKVEELLSPEYKPSVMVERFGDYAKQIPLLKGATSEEIAAVVLFLASDAAKSVTGARYVIDNGSSLSTMTIPLPE